MDRLSYLYLTLCLYLVLFVPLNNFFSVNIEEVIEGVKSDESVKVKSDESVNNIEEVIAKVKSDESVNNIEEVIEGIKSDEGTLEAPRQSSAVMFVGPEGSCDRVLEYTPHAFGIQAVEWGTFFKRFKAVIEKDTRIPTSRTRQFSTTCDWQKEVDIKIYRDDLRIHLGTITLKNLPSMRKHVPRIMVTFEVNEMGALNVKVKEQSMPDDRKHVVQLTIVSNTMNTREPMKLESEDYTQRKLDKTMLGQWFWELHRDITTHDQSVRRFEASPSIEKLGSYLNQLMQHQIDQCRTEDEQGINKTDKVKLNKHFRSLINDVVGKLKPPIIPAHLPHGLTDFYWNTIFNVRVPEVLEQLKPTGGVSLDPGFNTKSSWIQRASRRFQDKTYVEVLTRQYFWGTSGYNDPDDWTGIDSIVGHLNYFARTYSKLYDQKGWDRKIYEKYWLQLLTLCRNLCEMEQVRGMSTNQAADKTCEISQIMSELREDQRHLNGYLYVLDELKTEFGA